MWSAQLAARAEGVGSALTTVLGAFHGAEANEILGAPDDGGWQMVCCVSFGYPTGRWGVGGAAPVGLRWRTATAGETSSAWRSPGRSGRPGRA